MAVNDSEEPYHTQIYNVLESSLSGVEYIDMPFAPDYGGGADGFGSAKGIYVNSLQTTDNFYVPIFGIPEDALALAVYEEHTNKNVIPIDAAEVSNWGGSVHCLAMEILRANALDDECEDGETNNDNPCNPMECWDGVWYEIIIDCAEWFGVPCEGGVYIPPEEDECCSECVLLGDINIDSNLNVLDVVTLVQFILGQNELEGCAVGASDFNQDGTVNVLDVVGLVQYILSPRSTDATSAVMDILSDGVSITADGYIGAVQMTLSHDSGFVLSLTDDALVSEYKTEETTTTLIVVMPEGDQLFTTSDTFKVDEVLVANSESFITVTESEIEFSLSSAYPNPFNPTTTIEFSSAEAGYASVKIYNLMGQVVGVLMDGMVDAKTYNLTWNAKDLSSGVYMIKAESNGNVATQKVMLLK